MPHQTNSDLDGKTAQLIRGMTDGYNQTYGLGTMTCAVYDTAWVAMVSKIVDGQTQWLFPSSFRYLLDRQSPEGGWEPHASEVDGILNTLAALLALRKYENAPHQLAGEMPEDICLRISRATSFLRTYLRRWDVGATQHVGFEILVPTLLDLLEKEGITFAFEGRALLMDLNAKKMSHIDLSVLYGNAKTTMLHSLEAFCGKINFNQVSHHKVFGSMMASPSSTAAYLTHRSTWDDESEAYLRHVISAGEGKGNGSVPSAFPSTLFEITWVLSTLLESGFSREALGTKRMEMLVGILEESFIAEHGLIGFGKDVISTLEPQANAATSGAPLVGSDADDTAKAITTLELLGRRASSDNMIKKFEARDHFRTYGLERNPSFSANCNVLKALLHAKPSPNQYAAEIEKAIRFICNCWWGTHGNIADKWNLSPQYPMMLMAQALTCVIVLWDQGLLSNLPEQLLKDKVLVALFQALTRTLHTQNLGGSWGNPECRETTAYAILTLGTLASLPFADALRLYTESAIEEGRAYLLQADDKLSRPDYLWVEKVTYGSNALSQAYILASLKASLLTYRFGPNVEGLCNIPMKNVARFTKFYTQLPLFTNTPEWQIQASLLEGYLFLPQLRRVRLDIFPRSDMEEDKYFEYIPFTWTGSNNLDGTFLGANFLYEMMIVSFLNYQADEYMEAVVGTQFSHALNEVKDLINRIFHEVETKDLGVRRKSHQEQNSDTKFTNGTGTLEANGNHIPYPETDIMTVYKTLKRFVEYVLNHPEVMTASAHDQRRLRHEMKVFLLAHVDQIEDNNRFSQQDISPSANTTFQTPRGSFFDWVRSTSSDHTSCPYAFAFVTCLFGHGRDFFRTTEEKYIAQDLCRHLATMCRMYNDYGSLVRDRLEKNLNSVNFPEFCSAGEAGTDTTLKDRLFHLADYERRCLDMALAELRKAGRGDTVGIVKMFCNVTDTYGQIYVLKDIASRMVKDKETDA